MKKSSLLFGILLWGSIWGILEATFGNVLHFIGLWPLVGAIMTSIGLGLISIARSVHKKRGIGFYMSLVAASIKALDFFVPGSNVIRPIFAIIGVGIAYEAVSYVMDKLESTNLNQALSGVISGYLAITMFVFSTAYLLKFKFWLNKGFFGMLMYLVTDGWKFGLFSAITVFLGSNIVEFFNIPMKNILKSRYYYPIATMVILGCWIGRFV